MRSALALASIRGLRPWYAGQNWGVTGSKSAANAGTTDACIEKKKAATQKRVLRNVAAQPDWRVNINELSEPATSSSNEPEKLPWLGIPRNGKSARNRPAAE